MEYTVRVSKDWYRNDVIPIYKVAEAMARHAAAGHGPTLKNIRPAWYSLLLDDARDGKLLVCNEAGRIGTVQEVIEASEIPAGWSDEGKMHALHVKVKHLNVWGESNGNVFHILDSPGKVKVSDLIDWQTGEVLIAGYYRSYADFGDEQEEPKSTTETPDDTVTPGPAIEAPVVVTHSTKGTRRDVLVPVIEHAQSLCTDPEDVAQVWAQLERLAGQKYGPLVLMTDGDLVYTDGGETMTINREAISKRIKRAAASRR